MINYEEFTYADEQWIRSGSSCDSLGRDADQIERQDTRRPNYTTGLSRCERLETVAEDRIVRSVSKSGRMQGPHQAPDRVGGQAKVLRRDLIRAIRNTRPSRTRKQHGRDISVWTNKSARAIATLESIIEACIAGQRPRPTANTSKITRDRFWNEALAIWVAIGGEETGIAAAEFLVAVSNPVFRSVRAIRGRKTSASTPQNSASMVEWLRLRAKRQAATS